MKRIWIYLCLTVMVAVSMTSCMTPTPPVIYQTLDSVLTSGRMEYYGAFYENEGIDYDVLCLDLYSNGLRLNKQGVMEGTGTNLYISDIFVTTATPKASKAEDYMPEDTYLSDSLPVVSHFLRGVNYEGNFAGSYVLLMGEVGYSVLPITEGHMSVRYEGDTLVLDGRATVQGQNKPYPFHYRDILPVIRRER